MRNNPAQNPPVGAYGSHPYQGYPGQQPAQPRAYTLQQFANAVTALISTSSTVQNVWVVAELSDLRIVGGHCYVELVEKDATGQDVAKIKATCWANTFYGVRGKFIQATGRELSSGLKVMLRGSAVHHAKFGLSFNIFDIDPSYTLGDIERVRREILNRLHREGVLGLNRQLPLPTVCQRIAVISAEGAAGYGDFINQLDTNRFGFVFYPRLFPAAMQGVNTAPSVLAALSKVEMSLDLWDCVVIVRGGGSTTDMTGFDSYDLARRVATFPIPVVVGIGHERDRNVLDEIACVRCKTPTAVGAWLVERLADTYARTQGYVKEIMDYASSRVNGENTRIAHIAASIPVTANNITTIASERLRRASGELPLLAGRATAAANADLLRKGDAVGSAASAATAAAKSRIDAVAQRLENNVAKISTAALSRIDSMAQQLAIYPPAIIKAKNDRLTAAAQLLEALDPSATLRRGYSITRVDGHAVTDAATLSAGTRIETRLFNGTVTSVVEENND